MSETPFFSILIPAMGRPEYLHQAIMSVLLQDFDDFELIISNNGGVQSLRDVADDFSQDVRITYLEQEFVLNMPAHWEVISSGLKGKYFLILTDRSLFYQGTLRVLFEYISTHSENPEVISWPWDIYLDHLSVLSAYPNPSLKVKKMEPIKSLLDSINNKTSYPYLLPRALNSCVSVEFMNLMRDQYDSVFRTINPDFTFSYLCLLNVDRFFYIDQPLFISQGTKVSNGGNSYCGDASKYQSTLGLKSVFNHTPLKLSLVQNSIHEDFLTMLKLTGREDLVTFWDRANYFNECGMEIKEKRKAGVLASQLISEMEKEFDIIVAQELREISIRNISGNSFLQKLYLRLLGITKNIVVRMEWLYMLLLLRKSTNRYCSNIIKAAGFEEDKNQ